MEADVSVANLKYFAKKKFSRADEIRAPFAKSFDSQMRKCAANTCQLIYKVTCWLICFD